MNNTSFGKGFERVMNRTNVQKYLNDIRKIKSGDLVTANLKLVVSIANTYGNIMPLEDMIQEGNIGLIFASRRYNPSMGEFSTYATSCIRRFIIESIERDSRLVRRPHHAQDGFDIEDSLDETFDDGEGNAISRGDMMVGDMEINDNLDTLSVEVASLMDKLSAKEKEVISMVYGIGTDIPMGYETIGAFLNLSAERVRQIHMGALGKMRG